MNEKLEIAKLATQLTIAMLNNKDSGINQLTYQARVTGTDKESMPALSVFDAVFKHLQATLSAQ